MTGRSVIARRRRQHERPVRQRVRRDRREHERVDRRDARSGRRPRGCRRSIRSRVATMRPSALTWQTNWPSTVDVDLDHPRERAARDDDVVEREALARPCRPRRSTRPSSSSRVSIAGRPASERLERAVELGPRPTSVRNPSRPRLTPRSGASRARVRDGARGVEQRAVAAERDDDVDARSRAPSRDAVGQRAPSFAAARALRFDDRVRSRAPRATSAASLSAASAPGSVSRAIEPTRVGVIRQWRDGAEPAAAGTRGCLRAVTGDGSSPTRSNPTSKGRGARPRRRRARAPPDRARCRPCRPRRVRLRTAA